MSAKDRRAALNAWLEKADAAIADEAAWVERFNEQQRKAEAPK